MNPDNRRKNFGNSSRKGNDMYKGTAGFIIATGYDIEQNNINPTSALGDSSILKRQVVNMQLAGLSPIVVLSGWDNLRVEHHLDYYGVVFFQMKDFRYIQLEEDVLPVLEYLREKCEKIVYAPVEYPLLQTSTIKKLIHAEGDICYPVYKGKRGFPTVIKESVVDKIQVSELKKCGILEESLNKLPLKNTPVTVEDAGVICNIKDAEGCDRILEMHSRQMQHPYVHVDIDFDTKVFDDRLSLLLLMIHETKSVKQACMRVSISVGKAWAYINLLEEKLQYPVVERRQGGCRGGGTDLTEDGKKYLEKYLQLRKNVQEYAKLEFQRIFEIESL